MTGVSEKDRILIAQAVVRAITPVVVQAVSDGLRAVIGKPTPDDLAKVSVALTDLGLRAVQQPVPVEVDNVVALRPSRPVDPDHSPPSPPPSAA